MQPCIVGALVCAWSVTALMPAATRLHSPGVYVVAAKIDRDHSDDQNGFSEAGLRFGITSHIIMLAMDGFSGRLRVDGYQLLSDGTLGNLEWQAVASARAGAAQRLMHLQTHRGVTTPRSCILSPIIQWESALLRAAILAGRSDTEQIKVVSATDGKHCFDMSTPGTRGCDMLETLAIRLLVPAFMPTADEIGPGASTAFYRDWLRAPTRPKRALARASSDGSQSLAASPFIMEAHLVGIPPMNDSEAAAAQNSSAAAPTPAERPRSWTDLGPSYAGPCLRWLHQTRAADWSLPGQGKPGPDARHSPGEMPHEVTPVILPTWPDLEPPGAATAGKQKDGGVVGLPRDQTCLGAALSAPNGRTNVTVLDALVLPLDAWDQLEGRRRAVRAGRGGGDQPQEMAGEGVDGLGGGGGGAAGQAGACVEEAGLEQPAWLRRLCGTFGWRAFAEEGAWDLARLNGVHCEAVG